jgi:2-dehydropantoate 2-reductase
VADAELVLVTVKSAATATAGDELAGVLKPGAVVVSFQNGIRNADVLRERLRDQVVLSGMVPFNVLNRGGGAFHQGTSGGLEIQEHAALTPYVEAFAKAGLPLKQHADLLPVQWAKLLLNLNNPINALSDLPLLDELSQRSFRRCLAAAQSETLALLDAAGIKPAQLLAISPHRFPALLRLPDFIYKRLAGKTLAIDPLARTSMWEDLQAGRRTEIDYINGEVVRLAESLNRPAPINAKLVALIRATEQAPRTPWPGPALLHELTSAPTTKRRLVRRDR